MDYEEAKSIVNKAIIYKAKYLGDNKAKENVINAIKWMAIINGWNSREQAFINIPEYAKTKYREWVDTNLPVGIIAKNWDDKSEILARFVAHAANSIIEEYQKNEQNRK